MKTFTSRFVFYHVMLRFQFPIVLVCGVGMVACRGEDMATEVATPLQEFKVKRLAIEKKAETDTAKELQMLIKKLEKVSKGNNRNPKAGEQAASLLEKIKSPTFIAVGLQELMNDTQVGVNIKAAEMVSLAYKQRRVTVEDWATLPGDAIELTMKAKQDTGIDVKPGDFVLVCPHPTQKWRMAPDAEWQTFDGRTNNGRIDNRGEIQVRIINPNNAEIVEIKNNVLFRCTSEGRLFLESRHCHATGEGTIECKAFKVVTR